MTDAPGASNSIAPPWRLIIFVLASVVGVLALRVAHSLASPWIPVAARPASFAIVMAGGLLLGHAWTLQQVEPRGWSYVGLGKAAWQRERLVLGAGIGAMAIVLPVGLLFAIGWVGFEPGLPGSIVSTTLVTLAFLFLAALWEELFVRGYAFSVLREHWGDTRTLTTTSVAFGALHLLNDGASVLSLAVVILAGVFLGLVRIRTGSLAAAWAAHLAWNVMLVSIFHATVSGVSMSAPGYRLVDRGPDLATGGAWGPEGGLFAAAGLALAIWTINRRRSGRLESEHE